jgi:hypothetical protein
LAQVEPSPCIAPIVGSKKRIHIAIEGIDTGIDSGRAGIGRIVNSIPGAYHDTRQQVIGMNSDTASNH